MKNFISFVGIMLILIFCSLFLMNSVALSHHVSDYIKVNMTINGKVHEIIDGDTFKVTVHDKQMVICRMAFIDAPEIGQPLSGESKNALKELIQDEKVTLDVIHVQPGNTTIAITIVRLHDKNINQEMVRNGWAESYKEFLRPPFKDDFLKAERDAKKEERGIWGLSKFERPSEYRAKQGIKSPFTYH